MKKSAISLILWYLRVAAKIQLQKNNPTIIGVAGSSGKSSLCRLTTTILETTYAVSSTKEKNSETGIPLHILNVHFEFSYVAWIKALFLIPLRLLFYTPTYKFLIAEMGIDSPVEPKNMGYLLKIVQPTIGIVTNVALEHSVYFDEYIHSNSEKERQEKILQMTAQQELLLLTSLPRNGTAIVNLDDAYIVQAKKQIKAKQVTISLENKNADLYGTNVTISLEKFSMDITWHEKTYTLTINQLLPAFYAYEFLFALGVGLACDIPLPEAIQSLEKHFSLPPGRLSLLGGIKQSIIIDSSYNNATLEPVIEILDLMKRVSGRRRRLAIIGDMRELGSQSKEAHEKLAEKIASSVNEVILIGPLLKNYATPILKRKKMKFQSFTTFTNAKQAILNAVQEKDLILVKSSQNTLFLERAVELLLADKIEVDKLCRRGEFWDKKRADTP